MTKKLSKTEIINNLSKEDVENLITKSKSISDMLRQLKMNPLNDDIKLMRKQILFHNLEPPKYKSTGVMPKVANDKLFINGSTCSRSTLIKRILDDSLLDYLCKICDLGPEYNGKKLVLQLDHIDGTNNNNVIENLRFLCPNCHSQTETHSGKQSRILRKCKCGVDIWGVYDRCDICFKESGERINIKKVDTCKCGKIICNGSKHCKSCYRINSRIFNCSKEELEDLVNVQKLSLVEIGRRFNVTDNSIRKRCDKLGIEIRKKKNCSKRNTIKKIEEIDPNINVSNSNGIIIKNTPIKNKCECGKVILKDSKYCNPCFKISTRGFEVSKEELEDLVNVQNLSFAEIGKRFNVTDKTIRNRCKILEIKRH